MKKSIIVLILALSFTGCKQPVVLFSEPQPIGIKSIKAVPKKLHGNYLFTNDTTQIIISERHIIKNYNLQDSLGTTFLDTIFNMDENNILKTFKGYYFLNCEIETGVWKVEKLKLKNGTLSIGNITSESELETLEIITETKSDTIRPFKVNPTKKQLKTFLDKNGFAEEEVYIKIK